MSKLDDIVRCIIYFEINDIEFGDQIPEFKIEKTREDVAQILDIMKEERTKQSKFEVLELFLKEKYSLTTSAYHVANKIFTNYLDKVEE